MIMILAVAIRVTTRGGGEVTEDALSNLQGIVESMIDVAGMAGLNRDVDIHTSWTVFHAPALYDDKQDGETDNFFWQGTLFERLALEEGGIIHVLADGSSYFGAIGRVTAWERDGSDARGS